MTSRGALTQDKIRELLAAEESDKKHKQRTCPTCKNVFTTKRSNQVYCSVRCRDSIERATRLEDLGDRTCAWCGIELHESVKLSAKFCSDKCRAFAFRAKPCVYCGEVATTRDHFVPRAFVKRVEDFGWANRSNIIVPACIECNSTAGAEVFMTLTEKRRYIHDRYRKKYKKLIDSPSWTEEEIDKLGHSLKVHVRSAAEAQKIIKARLRWPAK